LLFARTLLTGTELSITEIAFTAGFGSIRRFNELFKKHYRITPRALRRPAKPSHKKNDEGITLHIVYRPPYKWDGMISFLAGRAIPGVESVMDAVYRRTVTLRRKGVIYRGWISVENNPEKNALMVKAAPPLLPVLPEVLSRVRRLFDTDCCPMEIYEKLLVMNDIKPGICVPGTRLPGCFDPFEMSVRAVLGQQISVKAARTLAKRFAAAFGEEIAAPFEELCYTFPEPETIYGLKKPVEDQLGPLGIIGARARSLHALAEALVTGKITLSPKSAVENEMQKLRELPGFGPWTINYIAMRALSWPDAFPHTDYGIKKALEGIPEKHILALSEAWRPWRAYAAINLWNSLEHV
jgi:AraC family transcriptional regulator of adaptative response / DNA-3-methyladenine glycosylase II